jgi:hypothetical protein
MPNIYIRPETAEELDRLAAAVNLTKAETLAELVEVYGNAFRDRRVVGEVARAEAMAKVVAP